MENLYLEENNKNENTKWKVFLKWINNFNKFMDTIRNILFFVMFIFVFILIIIIIVALNKISNIFNIIENDVIGVIKTLELNVDNIVKNIENLPNIIKNGVTSIF